MADMRNTKAWMIAMTAAMAACAFAADVSLTTVGGDDITGNTLVVTGVGVTETDPTVPAWAKAAEPPSADVDAQEITNVAEAVAGNVALAATNYTDAATSLTPVFDSWRITQPQSSPSYPDFSKFVFVFNEQAGWWDLYYNGTLQYAILGDADATFLAWDMDTRYEARRGDIGYVLGTQTNKVLASTNAVASAIASAVPAGVVVTNEYGEVPSLTVASLQSAMPSFGAMSANSADITTFLTVGGTNILDAIADAFAAIASTASTIANAGYLATNAYGAVSADLTVDGNLTVGSRGTISAEELNIYTRASIGITDGSLTIGSPEGSGSLVVGTTNVMAALASKATSADIASAISTNNAAFVEAVTNCPVVLTSGGGVDYGDFGTYGTLGALLAALAAAVVALRNAKVTAISAQSTDAQYPSAKCVWDIVGDVESALAAINGTAQSGNGGSGT